MYLDVFVVVCCYEYCFDDGNLLVECNICCVLWFIVSMMLVEIVGGWWFNFMVVFVDGWYMSLYVFVLGLVVFVYCCVCCYVYDLCFVFGIWKIEILVGYISVIVLFGVVVLMVV